MKKLLLTNDDGVNSPGLQILREFLASDYEVYLVAPDRERSATSMALTLHTPLRITELDSRTFSVTGTTCDCVNLALQRIVPGRPDFVVSGMNLGENLADDVFFSGTVGGAFSGYLYGIPSMAVSLLGDPDNSDEYDFSAGAELCRRLLSRLLSSCREPLVLNLNIPARGRGKVMVTRLGRKRYQPQIEERRDPRGRSYFWIGPGSPVYSGATDTDVWAVANGYASLGVIHYDLNGTDQFSWVRDQFDER